MLREHVNTQLLGEERALNLDATLHVVVVGRQLSRAQFIATRVEIFVPRPIAVVAVEVVEGDSVNGTIHDLAVATLLQQHVADPVVAFILAAIGEVQFNVEGLLWLLAAAEEAKACVQAHLGPLNAV